MSNKIYTESYPCSNIIDNTNITNSLEYLEYHSLIEKNNTKDMIKLNKKLNDHYGKYNDKLENYLINNANTSKENYNNYINTNKELYNELMMSRESVIGLVFAGIALAPIVVILLFLAYVGIATKMEHITDMKKISKELLKDPELMKEIKEFQNDLQRVGSIIKSYENNIKPCEEKLKKFVQTLINDDELGVRIDLYNSFSDNTGVSDSMKNIFKGNNSALMAFRILRSGFEKTKKLSTVNYGTMKINIFYNNKWVDDENETHDKIHKLEDENIKKLLKNDNKIQSIIKSFFPKIDLVENDKYGEFAEGTRSALNYSFKINLSKDYTPLLKKIKKYTSKLDKK